MIYSHSPYRHPFATALARLIGELVAPVAPHPDQQVRLVPLAPLAELEARAAAEKKSQDEFRRRRHALRLRGG